MFLIKQAALLSGFSVDTLRFYDRCELASPSDRSQNGYRYYNEEDITRLQFISRAKNVGFTLQEIRELLAIRLQKNDHSCETVKSFTANKLNQIEIKMAELKRIQQALKNLHQRCCGGDESAQQCTILQALDHVQGGLSC